MYTGSKGIPEHADWIAIWGGENFKEKAASLVTCPNNLVRWEYLMGSFKSATMYGSWLK